MFIQNVPVMINIGREDMSLLSRFERILKTGRELWENAPPVIQLINEDYTHYEGAKKNRPLDNLLIKGDNLSVCRYLTDNGYGQKLKLIYVDPPFFSKTDYKSEIKLDLSGGKSIPVVKQKAYKDSWEEGMEEYLIMLTARLYAFKELLSEDGCFWIHLDWHSVHYVKIILDEIFGEKNFVN